MKFFNVTCPCCKTVLVIDRINGKIVEARKPILDQTTGDRFKDALIKSKQQKADIENKFNQAAEAHKKRSKSLQNIFNDSLKKVKESRDESKPINPLDFD